MSFDVGFTLAGQPQDYWNGQYHSAIELNPIGHFFLVRHPYIFLSAALLWVLLLSTLIVCWNHPASAWIAIVVAIAHTLGAASWMMRYGIWGIVPAGVYIAVAAHFCQYS